MENLLSKYIDTSIKMSTTIKLFNSKYWPHNYDSYLTSERICSLNVFLPGLNHIKKASKYLFLMVLNKNANAKFSNSFKIYYQSDFSGIMLRSSNSSVQASGHA